MPVTARLQVSTSLTVSCIHASLSFTKLFRPCALLVTVMIMVGVPHPPCLKRAGKTILVIRAASLLMLMAVEMSV